MLGLNEKQWQLIYQLAVGAVGPLAKVISLFFDVDEVATKNKMDAVMSAVAVLSPLLMAGWMFIKSTNTEQLKSVAAMPPAQAATAAAALPDQALVGLVTAMPDKAIVTAAGALPGVQVRVAQAASDGAKEAANDSSVPGVNIA